MATIRIKLITLLSWQPGDVLRLYAGSENAASLAASTPAGGVLVAEVEPWPAGVARGGLGTGALGGAPLGYSSEGFGLGVGELGFGALGVNDVPRTTLEYEHLADDVCATLPVGVCIADAAGNESTKAEAVLQLSDPPQGARNLRVGSTGNIGEALLTWTPSKHVPDAA